MTDSQFAAIDAHLQEIADSMKVLPQVAANTKPTGKVWQLFNGMAIVVTIGGVVSIIDQFFEWFGR
jgi:ABC-type antimicrobial peptide transport system permease subunit